MRSLTAFPPRGGRWPEGPDEGGSASLRGRCIECAFDGGRPPHLTPLGSVFPREGGRPSSPSLPRIRDDQQKRPSAMSGAFSRSEFRAYRFLSNVASVAPACGRATLRIDFVREGRENLPIIQILAVLATVASTRRRMLNLAIDCRFYKPGSGGARPGLEDFLQNSLGNPPFGRSACRLQSKSGFLVPRHDRAAGGSASLLRFMGVEARPGMSSE